IIGIIFYQILIATLVGTVGAMSDSSWIQDDEGAFYLQLHQSEFDRKLFGGLLAFSIIFIFFISVAYTLAYLKLRLRLKRIAHTTERSRSERALTYVAIVTCAVEMLYYAVFTYVFLLAKNAESDPRTFHFVLALQGNITSGIHPYLLLFFSDIARGAVGKFL
ncbi:hypothetical protein PENTCL1PPCAC_16407, partial [Pristionchus entomophagus]